MILTFMTPITWRKENAMTYRKDLERERRQLKDEEIGGERALEFGLKNFNAQAWVDVRVVANLAYFFRDSCGGTPRTSEVVRWALDIVHDMVLKKVDECFHTVPEAYEYLEQAGFSVGQYASGRQRMRPTLGRSMGFENIEIEKMGIEAYAGRVERTALLKGYTPVSVRREKTPEEMESDRRSSHFLEVGRSMEDAGLLKDVPEGDQYGVIKEEADRTYVAPSAMKTRPSDEDNPRTAAEQADIDAAQKEAMKEALGKPPTL